MNERQLEFVIFCIENIAVKLGVLPEVLYGRLRESGLLDSYIIEFYDVLHTQSKEYIMDDIIHVMQKKGVVI